MNLTPLEKELIVEAISDRKRYLELCSMNWNQEKMFNLEKQCQDIVAKLEALIKKVSE